MNIEANNCENNSQPKKVKPKTVFGTKSKVAGPSKNKMNVEHKVGSSCGGSPCYWLDYGQEIIDKTRFDLDEEERQEYGANLIRKKANKFYILEGYGILRKFIRIQLPNCILGLIRLEWSDPVCKYMGFKEQ